MGKATSILSCGGSRGSSHLVRAGFSSRRREADHQISSGTTTRPVTQREVAPHQLLALVAVPAPVGPRASGHKVKHASVPPLYYQFVSGDPLGANNRAGSRRSDRPFMLLTPK